MLAAAAVYVCSLVSSCSTETPTFASAAVQPVDISPAALFEASLGTLSQADLQKALDGLGSLPLSYVVNASKASVSSAAFTLGGVSLVAIEQYSLANAAAAASTAKSFANLGDYWQQRGPLKAMTAAEFSSGFAGLLAHLSNAESLRAVQFTATELAVQAHLLAAAISLSEPSKPTSSLSLVGAESLGQQRVLFQKGLAVARKVAQNPECIRSQYIGPGRTTIVIPTDEPYEYTRTPNDGASPYLVDGPKQLWAELAIPQDSNTFERLDGGYRLGQNMGEDRYISGEAPTTARCMNDTYLAGIVTGLTKLAIPVRGGTDNSLYNIYNPYLRPDP